HDFDLFVAGAVTLERVDRAADQLFDDEVVEARCHNREAQLATLQVAFDGLDVIHPRTPPLPGRSPTDRASVSAPTGRACAIRRDRAGSARRCRTCATPSRRPAASALPDHGR